jgi:polyhydroxyalkanoate synthesis regulator phasin
MACRGCGDAVYMTKDQVENYINKLIKDGELQPGLLGCTGVALPKGTQVASCDGTGVSTYLPIKGNGTKNNPVTINLSADNFSVNPITGLVTLKGVVTAADLAELEARVKTLEDALAKFEQLNSIGGARVGAIQP